MLNTDLYSEEAIGLIVQIVVLLRNRGCFESTIITFIKVELGGLTTQESLDLAKDWLESENMYIAQTLG
jgi:hypothetical protein